MKCIKLVLVSLMFLALSSGIVAYGDVSSTLPSTDLGSMNYFDDEIELEFSYTFNVSTQSFLILDIDYPEAIMTYIGYAVKIGESDVSSEFTLNDDGSSILLSCNSVSIPIATYDVTIGFNPIEMGDYSVSWRSIAGTFGAPPSVPKVQDISRTSEGTLDASIQIDLVAGWNLIGVPVSPTDPTIAGVFGGSLSKVKYIYSYDSGLYSYWINGLDNGVQTLSSLQGGYGYWVEADEAFSITMSGDLVSAPTYTGKWSLISITTKGPVSTEDALIGYDWIAIHSFDDGSDPKWDYRYNDLTGALTELNPGEGYWLNLNLL